jgi:hypothetical protein
MPRLDPPTRRELHGAGERSLLAAALFGVAALLVSRTGHPAQVWPYLAMALSVLPQALLALVARVDAGRHVDVRVRRRPLWVPGLVGLVLAGTGAVLLLRDGAGSGEAWAALAGAVAGLLAAVPPVLVMPRRTPFTGDRGEPVPVRVRAGRS